jgi:DNA uptake protein ComE-like DNA-binding protein
MGLYTRQQLLLLLLLVGAAGVGLAVVHWRAAHPELVERLEHVDREPAGTDTRPAGGALVAEPRAGRSSVSERSSRPPRAPKPQPTPTEAPRPPLDLNHATLGDLTTLPGVGPVLARRILETRDALERFAAVDDLVRVRGLGRARLERLRPLVSVLE